MVQIEMPTLLKPLTPRDGRQSDTALAVARGTRRLLRRLDYSTLTELPLLTGRRADVVALAMDATIIIGLILADAYGGDILRQAPEHRMAPATRRAVLMRFAHAAAHRLHRLSDPGGWRRAAGVLQVEG